MMQIKSSVSSQTRNNWLVDSLLLINAVGATLSGIYFFFLMSLKERIFLKIKNLYPSGLFTGLQIEPLKRRILKSCILISQKLLLICLMLLYQNDGT